MFFHEIAGELKTYMNPTGRGGDFVVALVGDTLRDPMTEEEEKMSKNDEFNPLACKMSINMLDQILEGKKFISKARAGLICSRYDGQDFAEEIDNLYDADKDHLQQFLLHRGLSVEIEELGSAVQDILNQIFHGLSKGIHDVDITLTIHDPKPSIKNLAGDRIYCEEGKLYIDGDVIELPIYRDDFVISGTDYDIEAGIFDEDDNKLFKNTDTNGRFHSDWCSMIYSRITLARTLLSYDGVILISIDDNEIENLRKICNEIFGEQNLVNCFVWNCSTAGGIRPKFASKTHEYILCYAKSKENLPMFFAPLSSDARKMYTQKDAKGLYRDKDFVFKNKSTNVNQKYLIECPDGEKVRPKDGYIYRFVRERFDEALNEGLVSFKKTNTGPLVTEDGGQAHWNIYIKKYLGDAMGAPSTLIPKEMMSIYNVGTQCVQILFDDIRVFENVKPVDVITYLVNMAAGKDSVIVDFFSGSATTAHAVMQLNADDAGERKFIMVQIPEKCAEGSDAYKAGFSTICEIGKERIRRAAKKIAAENPNASFDGGFRVFKLDESNMNDVYYSAGEYNQDMLSLLESNVKSDRTDLDLLFGCLLEWGLPLSMPYISEQIEGCTVHTYNDGDLIACFNENIPDSVIKEIAKRQPLRAVFRDSSFNSSPAKINVGEIFKMLAPDTRVKVI